MLSYLDPFSATVGAVLVDAVIIALFLVCVLLAYRQCRRVPLEGLIALGVATGFLAGAVYLFQAWVHKPLPKKDWQGNPIQWYQLTNPHPDPLMAAAPWWMRVALAALAIAAVAGFLATVRRLIAAQRSTGRRQRDDRRDILPDHTATTENGGGIGLSAHNGRETSRDGRVWFRRFGSAPGAAFAAVRSRGEADPWSRVLEEAARNRWTPAGQELAPRGSGPWDLIRARVRGHKVLMARRGDPTAGIGKSEFADVWLVHNPGTAEAFIEYATGSDELKLAQILTWIQQPLSAFQRPEEASRRLIGAELPASYARDIATADDVADWKRTWNTGVDGLLPALDDLAKAYPNTIRHNQFQRYGTYTRNFADRIEVQIRRVEGFDYSDGYLLVRDTATGMQLRCEYPDTLPATAAVTGLIRGQLDGTQQP
jgi:hypothetical protein